MEITRTFVTVECCNCHVVFAMDKATDDRLRESHDWFYCPFGHRQHYTGETEEERLRKRLARAKSDRDWYEHRAETLKRSRAAIKGQLTKVKRRVAHGVCPCCRRTFQNLANHMAAQHPDYEREAVQEEPEPKRYVCGSIETHSGEPCQRTVAAPNEECWQHGAA